MVRRVSPTEGGEPDHVTTTKFLTDFGSNPRRNPFGTKRNYTRTDEVDGRVGDGRVSLRKILKDKS